MNACNSHATPGSCLDLLVQMVSFDTVNRTTSGEPFAERALAEHLERLAQGWGLATQRLAVADDAYNLLITPPGELTGPVLLLDSHLDTVGAEGMTIDPFAAKIAGGRLYSRGACDTKGSGAAMLWALKTLVEQGEAPIHTAVLFSIDEEVTRTGAQALVDRQLPTLPWRAAAAITGEPTGLRVVAAHNGLVRWRVRTRGVAAHSSEPSQGRSAISDMVRVVDAIEKRYIPQLEATHPLCGRAQCSVNLISGGQQINMIPDACEISLDRRVVPGEDASEVLPAVERILQSLRRDDPALEVEQLPPRIEQGLTFELNGELVEKVGGVLAAMGLSAEPTGAKYGTHASTFAAAGIPAIALGPGDIAQAHSKDEYLALEQLELAERVYRQLTSRAAELIP